LLFLAPGAAASSHHRGRQRERVVDDDVDEFDRGLEPPPPPPRRRGRRARARARTFARRGDALVLLPDENVFQEDLDPASHGRVLHLERDGRADVAGAAAAEQRAAAPKLPPEHERPVPPPLRVLDVQRDERVDDRVEQEQEERLERGDRVVPARAARGRIPSDGIGREVRQRQRRPPRLRLHGDVHRARERDGGEEVRDQHLPRWRAEQRLRDEYRGG
jgi:hypothetical protein